MSDKKIFLQRRRAFLDKIKKNSVVIISANSLQVKSADVHFPFRQNNNFYYLTGFPEPDAILLLVKHDSSDKSESILLCSRKNPLLEQWTGYICGSENAKKEYLFDQAFDLTDKEEVIFNLLKDKENIYYSLGLNNKLDTLIIKILNNLKSQVRQGISIPDSLISYEDILGEMRLIKSEYEINLMQNAVDISTKAHIKAMQSVKNCNTERQLYAEILREFYYHGASGEAYTSIVAGGKNACILHYIDNNKPFAENNLVLIDAGCEFENYASDITRTFPVSGKFTKEQLEIYQLVLDAQLAGIEQIYPGATFDQAQKAILDVLVDGLLRLKILKGNKKYIIEAELYKPFYMHKSGHYLGMDTHDVGSYKIKGKWRALEPGMVLTVEPGLYLSGVIKDLSLKWHNIGIRIEDDVLVTKKGHKVLSNNLPKKVDDIYNLI